MRARSCLLAVTFAACATSGGGVTERSFTRADLAELGVKKVALAVVAAGPPRIAEATFSVRGFDPPSPEGPLAAGPEDDATREAVTGAVAGGLIALGYTVVPACVPSAEPPGAARTSTPAPVRCALPEGATLRTLTASSDADAIAVVRVVPVDEFQVDVGQGVKTVETALGREKIRDTRMEPRQGRLLVGQLFLFDRKTGLRLFSRQAPDYPEDGRLTPDHPFLRSGFVHPPGSGPPPPAEERARKAAAAFAPKILEGLPAAKQAPAAAGARAALEALDPELERTRQSFLDGRHFLLDVSGSWGAEPSRLGVTFYEAELDPLGAAELSPSGVFRISPRLGLVLPGGLALNLAVPIVLVPSSFGRTYHQDNPSPSLMNPDDREVHVEVRGTSGFGVEGTVGWVRPLSSVLYLVPRGGVFFERWSIAAGPSSVVPETTRTRIGALGGVEGWIRAGEDGLFFLRGSVDLRLGADTGGPFLFGAVLSLGAGVLL